MSEHYSLEDECAKQCRVVYLFKLLRRCGTKQALLWAKWGYFCGKVPADTSAVTHKAQEKEFFHLWLVARPDPAAQLRRIMVALGDSYFPAKKQIVTRYIQGHLPRCIQRLYMVIIHNKILCCSPQLKGRCMVLFLWSLSLVFMGLYTFRQGKGAKKFYYPGEGSLQQCSWPSYGHGHYIWERISSVTCLVLTTQVLSVSFCAAAIPNCHSETGDVFYCGSVKVCLQLKGEPRS